MSNEGQISLRKSIGGKIVIIFSLLTILIVGILTFLSVNLSKSSLYERAFEKLESVRNIKSNQISDQMERSDINCQVISHSEDVKTIYSKLKQYHDDMSTPPGGNLNIVSDEYKDIANGEERVELTKVMELFGYYDIFIICWDHGHVLWTVTGESDLGENLSSGYLKESGLGRVWKQVTTTGKGSFQDFSPYAPSGGEPASFIGHPVLNNSNRPIAVVAIQLSMEKINNVMQERSGMGKTGETYLVGSDKLMRSDSYLDPVTHSVIASFKDPEKGSVDTEMLNRALKGDTDNIIGKDYNGNSVFSSFTPLDILGEKWVVLAEIDQAEVDIPINSLIRFILIGAVLALIIGVITAILFSKSISKPILHAVAVANALEKNDLSQEMDKMYLNREDETGILANSLQNMKKSLTDIIKQITSGVAKLSTSSTELSSVSDTMNVAVSDTNQRTTNVASAIEEMDVNMNNSAAGIEQTSTNLNSVASASTEMNATITEISKNTERAKEVTDSAVVLTNKVSGNINTLGDSAKEIGNVTETISNISSQTNLLALNATIEAARAGSAGKGFAVVAGEIKDLAHQTATATEDIKTRIMGIQEAVNLSIGDIGSVSDVVSQVNEIVNSIAAAIEEQSITTRDISKNINEASAGVSETAKLVAESASVTTEIAGNITKVSDSTNNVAAQGEKIVNSISDLNILAEQLQDIVQLFKMN